MQFSPPPPEFFVGVAQLVQRQFVDCVVGHSKTWGRLIECQNLFGKFATLSCKKFGIMASSNIFFKKGRPNCRI